MIKTELFRPRGIKALLGAIFTRGVNLGVIPEVGNRLYPSRIAMVLDEQAVSYAEFYCHTVTLASHLKENYSLTKGKKIGIACRNHAEHVYTLFAAALTGADVYLVHPEMGKEALEKLLHRFRFELFVHDEELTSVIKDSKSEGHFLPARSAKGISIQMYLSGTIPDRPLSGRCYLGKVVVLTSGSTGEPKTASRKASATAFLSPFLSLLKQLRLDTYESLYPATPLYHGFGLAALIVALLLGKRVYLQERFSAPGAARMIDRYRIEVITVVPAMLGRLLEVSGTTLSSLRCILTGGAMLHPVLVEKTALLLQGNYVYNLYGTSGAGFCFIATPTALAYHPRRR